MIDFALYQPDIAPNAAAVIRLGTCLGMAVHIIEPAGFVWSDKGFRRTGMDYLDHARMIRHDSWERFLDSCASRRLVLATTRSPVSLVEFRFERDDILLLGRESSGVPEDVHTRVNARVTVPMRPGLRSLNIVTAAAMIATEALRQTDGFPALAPAPVSGRHA